MNARTIESVLDLRTGKEIQASDFFSKPIDEIFKLRYEFESGIREKKPRVVCFFCKQSIKIRGRVDSKRILHFAHLKDSDDCPQKTDNKSHPSKINCKKNKVGIGDTPRRGNFTIATKTNPYGKIITFLSNHQYYTKRVV